MGISESIRTARIRAGKSKAEVAQRLGLNTAWYDDLERRDDELPATLTIFQAVDLASLLGVRVGDLFGDGALPGQLVAIIDLPERIRAHLASGGLSLDQFEDQVGWELGPFLASPVKMAAELPIAFFQALAAPLGMHWLSLVPAPD
jgi:transcriptional regulator with XRE-family HTH domain